jgi:hypothetical protein
LKSEEKVFSKIKLNLKTYIHGYVQKLKNNCINLMIKDFESKINPKKKFLTQKPFLQTLINLSEFPNKQIVKIQRLFRTLRNLKIENVS